MNILENKLLPDSRTQKLIVQELDDELLIYDLETNKAFCLNKTASLILNECDGKKTIEEACQNLSRKLKTEIDENIVWMALGQLKKRSLLMEDNKTVKIPEINRRQLVKSGLALGVALPLITMIVAPTAVMAQSCTAPRGTCTLSGECCSGTCSVSACCVPLGASGCNTAADCCNTGVTCTNNMCL